MGHLEELDGEEFLVLTRQNSVEIVYCCLRLLPFCSSIHHQTNVENSQIRTEDHLSVSRIRSHHLLLEIDHHDEEEYSVVLTLGDRYANKFLAPHRSKIFHR